MKRPLLVFEDVGPAARRRLCRLFGVTWAATRFAWVAPLFWGALGMAVAAAESRPGGIRAILTAGAVYGLLIYAANLVHTLGPILLGRLAGAPMAVNVLTATRPLPDVPTTMPGLPPTVIRVCVK